MAANYNNSAWFYDRLSRLVYGRALISAQVYLVQFIPPRSSVLIVGGGTGWILEKIAQKHRSGLNITYVEVAPNMMRLSEKRNCGENRVIFINKAAEHIAFTESFDVILTPFLFDNFTEKSFRKIFSHLSALLKPNGLWLNCDFQLSGMWWQAVLLKTMFIFFGILCGIEAKQLPAIATRFQENGYCAIDVNTFFGDFIISECYKRQQ